MVLVGVREENPFQSVFVFEKVGEVWNDNIDAVMFFVREGKPHVDNNEVVSLLDQSAILTDLARTTERNDFDQRHRVKGYRERAKEPLGGKLPFRIRTARQAGCRRLPEPAFSARYPPAVISEPERKPRNPIVIPLVLLVVSAIAFWALPFAWKGKAVQVQFEQVQK